MPDVPAKRKEESLEIECLVHRPAKRKEEYIQQSKTKTALRLQQIRKQENNENILIPNKKKREQAQAERKAKRIQENTQTKEIENKIMANQKTRRESLKNILKEVEA